MGKTLFLFMLFVAVSLSQKLGTITIKNVDRVIDISSQLVKISNIITFENAGSSPVATFTYVLDSGKDKLAYFLAQSGDPTKTPLKYSETYMEKDKKPAWSIELREPLQPGKSTVVDVECIFTHMLEPHPAAITQKEKQLVLYHGNHYFYSPYPTVRQTTTVNLGSKNIESYTKLKPVAVNEATITYGPYENIPPYSENSMVAHYENNSPFLTITNLERVIEVSHWGNIAVEEIIDLQHTGAILKGPFSRYEYQREAHSGLSSIKSFKTILPAAATDAYFRDEIGNISTSHMKILSDSVELDLRPRFPLFGGWRTHYVIGYNVPSYEYLYNSGDDYLLKMRFLDHVFDDMVVDQITTKIILPEGARNIKLTPPYPVERLPDSLHFTYLDVKGRTVIVLRKNNLVENHIQDFKLQYQFPRLLMLQEPLLVIIAFYLLFLVVIIYVRLDFSITKDEGFESRMRIAGYCEKILHHQDKRAIFYRSYDEIITKLKLEKNVGHFQVLLKSKNQDYRSETAHITELMNRLRTDTPDIAEKVHELQKIDRQLRDLYTQHQNLFIDKLAPGKITRQQFVDYENQINRKKDECTEKINNIIRSFQ